jgi:hypothetical protein
LTTEPTKRSTLCVQIKKPPKGGFLIFPFNLPQG